jgi:hypothetical protein
MAGTGGRIGSFASPGLLARYCVLMRLGLPFEHLGCKMGLLDRRLFILVLGKRTVIPPLRAAA